ncbi:hypothetical protein FF38_09190 [Lucilia cuprina]|uniref:Uncharacterized protein n=1 Tax=Lucilia cuprina TaxID=7375 RepID=A0A0L0BW91_LUCCU|nr:hypothetical protein FF38_09190 [Lucilia cuprina]
MFAAAAAHTNATTTAGLRWPLPRVICRPGNGSLLMSAVLTTSTALEDDASLCFLFGNDDNNDVINVDDDGDDDEDVDDNDDDDDNVASLITFFGICGGFAAANDASERKFIVANIRDGAHVTSSSSTTTTSEHTEQDIRFFVCILHLRNIRAFMAFPQLVILMGNLFNNQPGSQPARQADRKAHVPYGHSPRFSTVWPFGCGVGWLVVYP